MVKAEIKFIQLKNSINKLTIKQRTRLLEELQRQTWENRFNELLKRIAIRRKKYPISTKEINKIVKEAQSEYYAQRRH